MRWVPAVLVAMSLLASSATFEITELPETDDHHGYRHIEGEAEGHHHGDTDDHHESPDSPCHHHESQVCSGHSSDLADGALTSILEPGLTRLYHLVTVEPSVCHSLYLILHVPIA
jgi:hypothetical protein